MRKLAEVEEAKAVMNEGLEWSVMRWLKEKKRVRKIADRANEALDALNREVKQAWPADLRAAHQALSGSSQHAASDPGEERSPAALLAERVRRADQAAQRARMEAERTFDDAEEQLSARLAREGCRKAIRSWELHEHAIRIAEAGLAQQRS